MLSYPSDWEACAPPTEPEHAHWNHYSYSQSPVVKVTPYGRKLGEIPHGHPPISQSCGSSEVHQDSLHWISYQLPKFWTAHRLRLTPVSRLTQSTLLNLCFCFIHLQKESRPDTSSSAWNQINNMKTTFLVPDEHAPPLFTLMLPPISSLLVTNHVLLGGVWFLSVK